MNRRIEVENAGKQALERAHAGWEREEVEARELTFEKISRAVSPYDASSRPSSEISLYYRKGCLVANLK